MIAIKSRNRYYCPSDTYPLARVCFYYITTLRLSQFVDLYVCLIVWCHSYNFTMTSSLVWHIAWCGFASFVVSFKKHDISLWYGTFYTIYRYIVADLSPFRHTWFSSFVSNISFIQNIFETKAIPILYPFF